MDLSRRGCLAGLVLILLHKNGLICTDIEGMPCLKWVVSNGYLKDLIFGLVQYNELFMGTFPKYIVGHRFLPLRRLK